MSKGVTWFSSTVIACAADTSREDVKAAALAAGMKSDSGAVITLMALTAHEADIIAHLDWWGYTLRKVKTLGETSSWEIQPK